MLLVCCCSDLPGGMHGPGRACQLMGRWRSTYLGPTALPANPSPLAICTKPCLLRPRAVRWAVGVWSEGTAGAPPENPSPLATCTKPCLLRPRTVRWAVDVWSEGAAGWITARRGGGTEHTLTAAAAATYPKHCLRHPHAVRWATNVWPGGTADWITARGRDAWRTLAAAAAAASSTQLFHSPIAPGQSYTLWHSFCFWLFLATLHYSAGSRHTF